MTKELFRNIKHCISETTAQDISWEEIAALMPKRENNGITTGTILVQPEWKVIAGNPAL